MGLKSIFVSAGEPSGDRYAAALVRRLQAEYPEARFAGCAGEAMRVAGVEPVVRAEELAVVGLVEVLQHIPRIWARFRRLLAWIEQERPDLVILTDSPDFHLRLARRIRRLKVPIVYFVAPQVWAWRPWRVGLLREYVDLLLCIFPFEESFFRVRGVRAVYIGHPLTSLVRVESSRADFFGRHELDSQLPLVAILPGSRPDEAKRHLPLTAEAARWVAGHRPCQFVFAAPNREAAQLWRRWLASVPLPEPTQVIGGETWDAIAHADVALAASGTVTIEAALLGTPTVAFYRVSWLTWWLGRPFVRVPYWTMVNLVAGGAIIPELIQDRSSATTLGNEVIRLLEDQQGRERMREQLRRVAQRLRSDTDPFERATRAIKELVHGSAER